VRGVARVLLAVVVVAAIAAAPTPAAARLTTKATIFRAFNSAGVPTIPVRSKSGYCFTGSLTINRGDAWRCFVGNQIYDPCFSSSKAPGEVICPGLQVGGGIRIRLTRAFPRQYGDSGSPSLRNQPWDIGLATGQHCAFASGASNVIHGVRLNYFCRPGTNYGLWGSADGPIHDGFYQ
jgi:hypothetical protein